MIYTDQEHMIENQQKQLDSTMELYNTMLSCSEKIYQMQCSLARDLLDVFAQQTKHLTQVKDLQELTKTQNSALQENVSKTFCCAKSSYNTIKDAQESVNKSLENQMGQFNRSCNKMLDDFQKTVPSGAEPIVAVGKQIINATNNAYDAASRTSKQFMDFIESSISAVTQATARAASAADHSRGTCNAVATVVEESTSPHPRKK